MRSVQETKQQRQQQSSSTGGSIMGSRNEQASLRSRNPNGPGS